MVVFEFSRGETIGLALDAVEGDPLAVTSVAAALKAVGPGGSLVAAGVAVGFEVSARAAAGDDPAGWTLTIGAADSAGLTPGLYAATGDSVRGALEAIAAFSPLSLVEQDGRLLLTEPEEEPAVLDLRGRVEGGRDEFVRGAAAEIPNSVTLCYHDPALDYQTGLQRAFRGGAALLSEQRALPVTVGAAAAKQLAETRLAAIWAGRAGATVQRSWRDAELRPGRLVRLPDRGGLWRIERWLLERMIVRLQLARVAGAGPLPVEASPGRPVGEADLRHGPTTLRIIELPALDEKLPQRPQLAVAAAGIEPGWRRAAVMVSFDGGASWQELGQTAGPATIGTVEAALPPGGSALFDQQASCVVQLLNDAMLLQSASDRALAAGANLAAIGDELVQFGIVQPLGEGRFRLSRLLRGRFGTEWAMAGHGGGEHFLLLDRAALLGIDAPGGSVGGDLQVVAAGIEDGPDGVKISRTIVGEALRPPAPVHLRAERIASGDLRFTWVRRSRAGWAWQDGGDVPISEESERYEVTVAGPGFRRNWEAAEPSAVYPAADQASDGASGLAAVEVVQIGTHGRSRPARLSITF